jgi:hypothetical protein
MLNTGGYAPWQAVRCGAQSLAGLVKVLAYVSSILHVMDLLMLHVIIFLNEAQSLVATAQKPTTTTMCV